MHLNRQNPHGVALGLGAIFLIVVSFNNGNAQANQFATSVGDGTVYSKQPRLRSLCI